VSLKAFDRNLSFFDRTPDQGDLGKLLDAFGAQVIVGHPTFRNADNIGAELERGIRAAARSYAEDRVAFVVSDGTWTEDNPDRSTLDAARAGAEKALAELSETSRERILVTGSPYDGYRGDRTAGKGSALKLIFDELAFAPSVRKVILLDGDLRNDLDPWFAVFRRVEDVHRGGRPDRDFFVTAKYARHFVDASLTRFVVGPLTTLMGCYVPGGISGDIVLSAGAVARERDADWTADRRRYGTDIATTFDAIADPRTDIYEVYLGAKLHDITDEAKLSVMPGEVIGSALSRLVHYELKEQRITRLLQADVPLRRPVTWGPEATEIDFIDPGFTDVFDVDRKRRTLLDGFPRFEAAMKTVLSEETFQIVASAHRRLSAMDTSDGGPFRFLDVTRSLWIEMLYESIGFLLRTHDIETAKQCLNYLYTAAFLEFCREKITALGARTLGDVRGMQCALGVPPEQAKAFYRDEVDAVVEAMAVDFYRGRRRILHHRHQTLESRS